MQRVATLFMMRFAVYIGLALSVVPVGFAHAERLPWAVSTMAGPTPVSATEEAAFQEAMVKRQLARQKLVAQQKQDETQILYVTPLPRRDGLRIEVTATRGLSPLPISHFYP